MFNKRYISLILYKAYADLRAESERYYISYLWWLIEPILHMCIYFVVFGILLGRGTENFVTFLLVGLVVWRWLTAIINEGSNAVLAHHMLFKQVYIPKYIFPAVTVCTQTFKFAIVFSILLIYLWLSGFPPSIHYLSLPLLFGLQLMFVSGIAFVLAAIFPYLPDMQLVINTGLRLLFFFSGIFYTSADIPPQYHFYFYLNPLAHLLESYRNVLMGAQWPAFQNLSMVLLTGLAGFLMGMWLLIRNDQNYAKVAIG